LCGRRLDICSALADDDDDDEEEEEEEEDGKDDGVVVDIDAGADDDDDEDDRPDVEDGCEVGLVDWSETNRRGPPGWLEWALSGTISFRRFIVLIWPALFPDWNGVLP
jgi:hypothetical protein